MIAASGVEVRYGLRVEKVNKVEGVIKDIVLSDKSVVAAKVFVDAGYEGDLMSRAGVESTVGRESQAEYGEEAAGIRFDKSTRKAATVDASGKLLPGISGWAKDFKEGDAHRCVMNYNFRLTVTQDVNKKVPIPDPKHYDPARYALLKNWMQEKAAASQTFKVSDLIGLYKRRNGKVEMNNQQNAIFSLGHFGGQFDYSDADYARRDAIYEDHWDYTLGFLKFLATDESVPESVRQEMQSWGLHKDEFADNNNLPTYLYIREARRMKGAYVITQKDVQDHDARRKEDSVGIASHFIDSHHVQRLAVSETEFLNEGRIWRMGYAWQIPYRCLTPKPAQCTNLLVPGAASLTHVAFCTYRLESVWMIGGHAAGVAAAMTAKTGKPVQDIDIKSLQGKLRAQKQIVDFIPDQPEKAERLNGPPEF